MKKLMVVIRKEVKFNDEVRFIVGTLEYTFLKGKKLPWQTTRDFSEQYSKYYDYAYRLIRASADFWNQNLSKEYGIMFDCDYHGFRWRFHRTTEELKDLCWIAAIRTDSHNKRSLNNFSYATEINFDVKGEVKTGQVEVIIPSSAKNYEDDES